MSAKHTPGPWEVKSDFVGPLAVVGANNTKYIAEVGSERFAEAQANAELIAAAPDMRDTLGRIADHECLCCVGDCGCGALYQEWAREAIEKAEGR